MAFDNYSRTSDRYMLVREMNNRGEEEDEAMRSYKGGKEHERGMIIFYYDRRCRSHKEGVVELRKGAMHSMIERGCRRV